MLIALDCKQSAKPTDPDSVSRDSSTRKSSKSPHLPLVSPAACPICAAPLFETREELGALTLQGQRIESTIYHASCITLTLYHQGSLLRSSSCEKPRNPLSWGQYSCDDEASRKTEPVSISWGLSPTTRKPVDGFLKMPSLFEQRRWVQFVDWHGAGSITVESLAVVLAAILPIEEEAAEGFVRNKFHVSLQDIVSEDELALHVFPYLERQCADLCFGKHDPLREATPFMRARDGLKPLTGVSDVYALRLVSRGACLVATMLFALELGVVVRSHHQYFPARTVCAAHALKELTPVDNFQTIASVVCLLESSNDDVRKLAFGMLPSIASQGNRHVVDIVILRCQHEMWFVRRAALEALELVGRPGNQRILDLVLWLMDVDGDARVREAAAQLLGKVAACGNQAAIQGVLKLLDDSVSCVRRTAESLLPALARGDRRSIDLFCSELENAASCNADWKLQHRALKGIGATATRGDSQVIEILIAFYKRLQPDTDGLAKDSRYLVAVMDAKEKTGNIGLLRRTAIHSLSLVADIHNKAAWEIVSGAVHDDDCDVAEAAICAFRRMSGKGDRRVVKVLTSLLKDTRRGPYACLRMHALETLECLASEGDRRIFDAVASGLKDGDPAVRESAANTISKIAKPGHPETIRLLTAALRAEASGYVRLAMQSALQTLRKDEGVCDRPRQNCTLQ